VLTRLAAEDAVTGVVVISAKENDFVAGADISMIDRASTAAELAALSRAGQAIMDRVAAIADRTPDQLLVTAYPVHVGGVQKRHAQIDRAVNGRDRLGFVGLPIEFGHAHATEAQRRYAQPVAQLSLLKHQLSPIVRSCRLAGRR
jgi:3-hydroxyacyl-CoA dehydrogenase/enoyl-CoA hydratase/3-hydroxybutyryl-CoA epimerase